MTLTSMTVREALRDGMAEEMRSDSSVFLLGEEVAEYDYQRAMAFKHLVGHGVPG